MLYYVIYSINAYLKLYNINITFLRVKTLLWGNKTQIIVSFVKKIKCVHKYSKIQLNK